MHPALLSVSIATGLGALLLALRALLHRGLTPRPDTGADHPAAFGLPGQAVRIAGARAFTLFAWFAPASQPAPAPTAVLLHGWGGHAGNLLPAALALHRHGYAVLLLEARNHGRSDRYGHSALPTFAEDLASALDWLATRPDVDPARCLVIGHSVGAAACLLTASRRHDLAAVVAIAAFAHPEQVMRRWLAALHVPYRPFGWLINRYVEQVIGARFETIAPVRVIGAIRCPVLLLHGRQDTTVPVADARALCAAGNGRVTLVECDGNHQHFDDLPHLEQVMVDFLQRSGLHGSLPLVPAARSTGTATPTPGN